MKILRVFGLLVFVHLLAIGCAKQQKIALPSPSVLGFTYCTPSGPAGWINVQVVGTIDFVGTVRHELKHIEQMRRFPNCEAWTAWASTNGPRIEAEAFCEEVTVETPLYGRDYALAKYARWLAGGYPHYKLTEEMASELIRDYC